MIAKPSLELDRRDAAAIAREVFARRLGYVPEWLPRETGVAEALARIFARTLQAVVQRLNQAPDKNKLGFFDLLGLALTPAQAARAPVVFQLTAGSADTEAPANTQLAAPPPPGTSRQIVFETERAVGVAAARIQQVASLWPGRDQYLDHASTLLAGGPFQLFRKPLLEDIPHELYLAHETLLALAGNAVVEVELELTHPGDEPLSILWQYWDGKVWRGFKSARPACSETEAEFADSTRGLTRSGRIVLETDCAETDKTTVNGIKSFWIRGKLAEPLLPEPAKALPRVDSVRLSTVVNRALTATLSAVIQEEAPATGTSRIHGHATNEAGEPLSGVDVKITRREDPDFQQVTVTTGNEGEYDSLPLAPRTSYDVALSFLALEASARLESLEPELDLEVDLAFNVVGLDPDKAFGDGAKLDVTKPFYPFGQQPQPGAAFYFSQEEVFSKPGALVQIYVARTRSPLDDFDISDPGAASSQREPLEHLIAWEYWNGERWVPLFPSSSPERARDLDTTGIIDLTVPPDMAPTTVNGEEALWMRARLVRGGFGFRATVPASTGGQTREFTFVINQPPSLAAFRIGYGWRKGPFHPEQVRTHNDFQYEDHTYEATWPGVTFLPFQYVRDVTPALYLGFDKKLPVAQMGLYLDILEKPGEEGGPPLLWEYYDGSRWRELSVEDETRHLRLPGILSFIAAEDSKPLARFGTELHWVRGRLKEDGPPGEPTVNGIFLNAVWASERRTIRDAALGSSSGLPDQVFTLSQIPVLAGERIEVQELSGPRANVEWRILAREVFGGDVRVLRELEDSLGREGAQAEIAEGDLRLRRDRNKRVIEVWVRWQERAHFFRSEPDERHYAIDRARGLLFFGDGVKGRIPPPGAPILCREHRAGGGLTGNVRARAIQQLLGSIAGLETVFNPRPAEGGADGETLESFGQRAPATLRHRGRAITPADYETLAREASPAVAVARAIPARSAAGRPIPGWVTLQIIPRSGERRPWPSFGLREHVRRFLVERAPAGPVNADQIYVAGPDYLPVDVSATLAPRDAAEAGLVEERVRKALEDFLHPLRGGPERRGWDPGRDLYLSDVASVVERVPGVDYVKELSLSADGRTQGERVAVADERVVVAGVIRLQLIASEA